MATAARRQYRMDYQRRRSRVCTTAAAHSDASLTGAGNGAADDCLLTDRTGISRSRAVARGGGFAIAHPGLDSKMESCSDDPPSSARRFAAGRQCAKRRCQRWFSTGWRTHGPAPYSRMAGSSAPVPADRSRQQAELGGSKRQVDKFSSTRRKYWVGSNRVHGGRRRTQTPHRCDSPERLKLHYLGNEFAVEGWPKGLLIVHWNYRGAGNGRFAPREAGREAYCAAPRRARRPREGSSVAVNGVCVTAPRSAEFLFR